MTPLAPYLSSFLREHLPKERRASQHTCEAYAQAFQLLLCFAARRLKIKPARIEIERLDAPLILAFLEHLEGTRGNSARTRNVRLAAINSFFRFLEYRLPSCLDQARRIHAIPMKKTDQALVGYLTRDELQALLDAPDPKTMSGIRDRAMLHLAFAAGLRVSELVNLQLDQIDRPALSTVHILGKGRRERVLPLWKETAAAIKAWLQVRPTRSAIELFLNARAQAMTRSGFEYILAKHVATAARKVPSIAAKSVSPHVLRHYLRHAYAPGNPRRPESLTLARTRQPAKHGGLSASRSERKARSARSDDAANAEARPLPRPRQSPGDAEHSRTQRRAFLARTAISSIGALPTPAVDACGMVVMGRRPHLHRT
jgi:integrase/recombinase XerD